MSEHDRGGRSLGQGKLRKIKSASGSIWQADWQDASGKRHRKCLSPDRRVAEKMLAELIRQRDMALAGLSDELGQERKLRAVCDAYLNDLRPVRRESYVRKVEAHLKALCAYVGPIQVRELRVERVLEYRRKRLADGKARSTCNHETGALRTALSWAARTGVIGSNPLSRLRPLPIDDESVKKRRRALTENEIEAFLISAREEDETRADRRLARKSRDGATKGKSWNERRRHPGVPQLPLWRLLVERGTRWTETVSLTWADVDIERNRLTISPETSKSRKRRVVPIPPSLTSALVALRPLHATATGKVPSPLDHVFLTPQGRPWMGGGSANALKLLRRILKRAGIESADSSGRTIDIHALRGTAATRLLRLGVPMPQIIDVFGWADARMLLRHYAHLRVEDTEAALNVVPELDVPSRVSGSKLAVGAEEDSSNEEGPITEEAIGPAFGSSSPRWTLDRACSELQSLIPYANIARFRRADRQVGTFLLFAGIQGRQRIQPHFLSQDCSA